MCTGLNPLIYTISALILLGTLAIVAIITCWIRVRRSYNRRMFQTNTNPQDYLDYISDNDFTPLATDEFAASLHERPPTYNESEDMNSETGEGSGTQPSSTRTPPPRPPPPPTSNSPLSRPGSGEAGEAAGELEGSGTRSSSTRTPPPPNNNSNGPQLRAQSSSSTGTGNNIPDLSEVQCTNTGRAGGSSSGQAFNGVDTLLSMDLETGNGTQQSQLESLPVSSGATESVEVGILIEFGD